MLGSRIGGTGAGPEGSRTATREAPRVASVPAVPGINEVWSLVSGTRSNPPHGPAYGGEYPEDGGYLAGPNGTQPGQPAPYAASEGLSGAAEYYYEGQYDQQQYQYDQYTESSAGFEGQAYYAQQGEQPGYAQQSAYPDGYEGSYPGQNPEYQAGYASADYAAAGYQQAEQPAQAGYQGSEYQSSEYRDPGYQGSEYQGSEYQASEYQGSGYQEYGDYGQGQSQGRHAPGQGTESGYAAEGGHRADPYAAESDYPASPYPAGSAGMHAAAHAAGAPLFGAAASFAMAGTATATATELLDEDLEVPESPQGLSGITTLPGREKREQAPETAPAADPAGRRGGRTTTLRTRPRTGPLGRVVQGVVLAALVGGAITYVAYDKSITLSIDGQTQTVHTFAGTVGAVLTADGVDTGSKDIVSPAPAASAASGQTITVRYGRPLDLSVNGVSRKTWVHFATVSGALQELGVRTSGAKTSDPLNAAIPRSGMNGLVVYTMRHVTFLVDGKSVPIDTTAATITAAMSQAGVVLHNQDAPSVAADSVPTDGETVSINRITGTTETKQVAIPFKTTQVQDASAYTGTSTVKTQGVEGEETVTYALLIVNGVSQKPKQISSTVTKQPVDEVLSVGTKALPTSASSLNWAAVANCESGGNPAENTGNGFYGMYQFSESTWLSLGGTGYPYQASAATQTAIAEQLYERSGAGQWPVCGKLLFS